jgi:hypothetical protein
MMDFWKGAIMDPADVLELTGQSVNPEVFTIHPTGNLIHVLLEEEPEEFGSIIIPKTLMGLEQMGVGYIIAAGPMAGSPDYAIAIPSPIGVVIRAGGEDINSSGLLGLHVIFGSHAGAPLRVSLLDREFRAPVLVMQSKDIKGVDTNPIPLTTRVVERSKK